MQYNIVQGTALQGSKDICFSVKRGLWGEGAWSDGCLSLALEEGEPRDWNLGKTLHTKECTVHCITQVTSWGP